MQNKSAIEWITLLANLGVVAGLVLVAYEVRQATLQAEAEAQHAVATELQEARKELALSADLAEIYLKATTGGVASLTPVEKFRLTEWETAKKVRIIGQIRLYDLGFMTHSFMETMLPALTGLEQGLWAELGISPMSESMEDIIAPLREEMGLLEP